MYSLNLHYFHLSLRFPNKPIPMPHLQPFHMISYEEEIDSIILTHCRYSLKFGKGQDVKYDFGALEKHIYDRFLVGKPEIDGATQSVMIYSSDVIQQDVFDQLRQKIKPQVCVFLHHLVIVLTLSSILCKPNASVMVQFSLL